MKAPKKHPERRLLEAFLRGRLGPQDQEAVENHIAGCDACCRILKEIPDDGLSARLRQGGKSLDGNSRRSLPDELRDHPRYRVKKLLGRGGMGTVFQAEHLFMERLVALKVIHQHLMRHPHAVDRFRQEVKAAARLVHPNIVTAYDADQAGEAHFLVMEFIDGVSLDRLVDRRGPLAVAHACNYVCQASQGLQHAFEIGMVHRDIKPHNLMLTRKGQVKILDFGLARLAGQASAQAAGESLPFDRGSDGAGPNEGLTSAGELVGTPAFMAPEQALDSRQADIRSDIYSLGCTLYYLLTGQTPFPRGSRPRSLRHARPVIELRPDLPAELVHIVERMMSRDPVERYQKPAEVLKALAPFARPGTTTSQPKEVKKPPAGKQGSGEIPKPVEVTRSSSFVAHCPYCSGGIQVPAKAVGASLLCPRCQNYFTAAPEEKTTLPRD